MQRAVVGIYGDSEHTLITNETEYYYGHYFASSVAYFYSFIRPVGDVLTNETVREVIDLEPGFATDLAASREKLIVVATNIYRLVKGVWTINECIIPNLPVDSHTVLSPQPPLGVSCRACACNFFFCRTHA